MSEGGREGGEWNGMEWNGVGGEWELRVASTVFG